MSVNVEFISNGMRSKVTRAFTYLPDVTQQNNENGMNEFLVELIQKAVRDKDSTEYKKRVHEQIAVEDEPGGNRTIFLRTKSFIFNSHLFHFFFSWFHVVFFWTTLYNSAVRESECHDRQLLASG